MPAYNSRQDFVAAERAANTRVKEAFTLDITAIRLPSDPFFASEQVGGLVDDALIANNLLFP